MRSIQTRKGMSIGDLYPAVLTVVMIGMMLGIGLYVLSTLHDSIATSYTGSQVAINTSSGTTTLTDAALAEFDMSAITVVRTNGTAVTNYTYTAAGVITWGSIAVGLGDTTLVNASTYTYNYDATDSPEESITTSIAGVATFGDWIAIIVVVIAAAIILGVVLSSFGMKRNSI